MDALINPNGWMDGGENSFLCYGFIHSFIRSFDSVHADADAVEFVLGWLGAS